jgi:2-amino-4-hydroxy-6-hydroxymethyldihydropteridine diphosphokinase
MLTVAAYIGVGSNLSDRSFMIEKAKEQLSLHPKIKFLRSASIYETEPIGGPAQGRFLNTVWEIETDLSAQELLAYLLNIEEKLGRKRTQKNAPRVIDLDLLFFGDEVINQPNLQIPHPRLQERWFVLKPLWDLSADLVHPIFKRSVCEMLDEINASHQKPQKT